MRLIDADALKYKNLAEVNGRLTYVLIPEEINNAPTVEQRPHSQWIPIKTRELTEEEKEEYPDCTFMYDCPLPEDGEEVLVTTFSGMVTLDTFYRDDGCYFESYCDEGDVIAWMPKPESYKKEGAE